jgi:LDH2 family malate/lactate/ureidoglycolate dehydrogenase
LKHSCINRAPALEIALDGFKIEIIDGEAGHGQCIKADAGDTALEFGDELGIGLAIG